MLGNSHGDSITSDKCRYCPWCSPYPLQYVAALKFGCARDDARAWALLQGHIVAEVCDLDNEPLVKMVGVEHVQTVVSHDIIGRLMIQCARQHGLAAVWQMIMGFEGAASLTSAISHAWSGGHLACDSDVQHHCLREGQAPSRASRAHMLCHVHPHAQCLQARDL